MQYGGAEKLVTAMLETFPKANIYTSVYDPKVLKQLKIPEEKITTSFIQKLPFKKILYKWWFFLYPLAFESLSSIGQLDKYNIVISSTARFAHGVLTKPGTVHIAYINSPGRMWWEPEKYFGKTGQRFFKPFRKWLRSWDKAAISRVDYIIANSKNVGKKIKESYGRKADTVVYPFAETVGRRKLPRNPAVAGRELAISHHPYLIVTRLVQWKRVDIAITAFKNNPNLGSLAIVGKGPEKRRLKNIAGGAKNIKFLTGLTDRQLQGYYKTCRALIMTQEEDFGITPLEAMSCGKPIIAYKKGGVLETVKEGRHGIFFDKQTVGLLANAINKFDQDKHAADDLKKQAEKFNKRRFQDEFRLVITNQQCIKHKNDL
jgi:glycosyltransferase involved in cell wall biosynthesis